MSIPDDPTRLSAAGLVEQFVNDWRSDSPADIRAYLPADDVHRAEVLSQLLIADIELRWSSGCGKVIEEYLSDFSELGSRDDVEERLILAEFEARRNAGESISLSHFASRFPLQSERWPAAEIDPEAKTRTSDEDPFAADDVVAGFKIIRLLGEGSLAKVYLAEELSLGRQVALKVSYDSSDEERLMARLEHPNIVPIYSQHASEGRKLIAMRYIRGATLASWMSNLGDIDRRTWRGIELTCWLREAAHSTIEEAAERVMDRRRFDRQGFVPIVCRLVLDVARGLSHAHQRDVLHGDVKPANIMLDVEGRAMLMDFNISSRPSGASAGSPRGGTLAHMSPEQLKLVIPGQDRATVDGRSDVYSLGVLFYELLTGQHPWNLDDDRTLATRFETALARRLMGSPAIPAERKRISIGLRGIVQKCLEPNPDDRYQTAEELIEDLQRHLSDRPLKFASDPSWLEQSIKWTRRHPRVVAALTTTVCLVLVGGAVTDLSRLARMESAVADCRSDMTDGKDSAAQHLSLAHRLATKRNWIIPNGWTGDRQKSAMVEILRLAAKIAPLERQRFSRQVDQHRAGRSLTRSKLVNSSPLEVYRVLQRADWESQLHVEVLAAAARQSLSEDVTELLVLRILFTVPADPSLWERIPLRLRSLPVIVRLRATGLGQGAAQGKKQLAELAGIPTSQFERYLIGVIAARMGHFEVAIRQMDEVIHAPQGQSHFWSHFVRAYCLERQGYYQSAVLNYTYCSGLRPQFAWPAHNIGLIHAQQQRLPEAVAAFKRALSLDPTLPVAHMNLGAVLMMQDDPKSALTSFDAAIQLGLHTAQVLSNRSAALARLGRTKEARKDLLDALKINPNYKQAVDNLRLLDEQGGRSGP